VKKIFALLLCVLLLGFCACGKAPEPEPVTTTEPAITERTTEEPITEATIEAPATTEPLITIPRHEWMSDKDARVLAAGLLEQTYEIFSVCYGGPPGDHEDMKDGTFRVLENPLGIYSIADVRSFIEKTYTKEHAQENFYDYNPDPTQFIIYFEKGGELYFKPIATGLEGAARPDTAKVKSQTNDTLLLTMDDGGWETTWQLKWQDGAWKLNHNVN